ncbi:MAG: gamma-glutamyltransferase [Planctomycetota bacterium]
MTLQDVRGPDRVSSLPHATRSEVFATKGMAATSQPLATQAAIEILRAGGNAIDAAIAANAVLALVEPTGCGLGGDLFAIVWSAEEGGLVGLNASGRSPASLTLEHLRSLEIDAIPPHGPLPVSVPGCVDGWCVLSERFGALPLAAVLAPAIRYARQGFPLSELVAYYWSRNANVLSKYPGFAEQFLVDGRAPAKGEVFRNPNLASTLEAIAKNGRDGFYAGEVAERIGDFMAEHGGFLTAEDLTAHRSTWVAPVSTRYRGYDVWELPPNGQGIAALQMLNLLEPYDLAEMGWGSADYLHHFVEAKKLAFEDRARLYADPDFANVPVAKLISKEYANERRKLIDSKRAAQRYDAGARLQDGDTIYVATGDAEGNMVSLIQSNYRGMGSGMAPDGLGFVLQDRGELFDLEPGRANTYAPGKRPFHTIIPAFVTKDGAPYLAFGVMGGGFQPQGHVQVLVNMLDFGMNLQEAGDAARWEHAGSSQPTGERMIDGGIVSAESGIGAEARAGLRERGHTLGDRRGVYGGYQAVMRLPTGVLVGASESRKDGMAAGY